MSMVYRKLAFLTLLLWSVSSSAAWEIAPIVWVDETVSLTGRTSVVLLDVTNDTGKEYEFDVIATISDTLKEKLRAGGITIYSPGESVPPGSIIIKNSLMQYEVGSAMDRWALAGGATICTVRTFLLDAETDSLLGEIVSTRVVDVGGLYTIGAYKTVPRDVAEEITEHLLPLLTGRKPSE